jgi:hypothetical protein
LVGVKAKKHEKPTFYEMQIRGMVDIAPTLVLLVVLPMKTCAGISRISGTSRLP